MSREFLVCDIYGEEDVKTVKDELIYEGLLAAAKKAASWGVCVDGSCAMNWLSDNAPEKMHQEFDYRLPYKNTKYGWPAVAFAAVCGICPSFALDFLEDICVDYTDKIDEGRGDEVAEKFRQEAMYYKPNTKTIHVFLW